MAETKKSFTFELDVAGQEKLAKTVASGNYRLRDTPYSLLSFEGNRFNAVLYEKEKHGKRKLVVQGAGAADFVEFTLEPGNIVQSRAGYEEVLDPSLSVPHGGSDESGKGDYFGPLVVCCAYIDAALYGKMSAMGVKDCKAMTDKAVLAAGAELRKLLGPDGYATVKIPPPAYNRLYFKLRNANTILAWAHATAIEELLGKRPEIEHIVVDQFAPTETTVRRQLKPLGRKCRIIQRHKAESDMAVAAASVIAREIFLKETERLSEAYGEQLPRGASDPRIETVAAGAVQKCGAKWLMNNAKVQFKTTDRILASLGMSRQDLPPEGRITSISKERNNKD